MASLLVLQIFVVRVALVVAFVLLGSLGFTFQPALLQEICVLALLFVEAVQISLEPSYVESGVPAVLFNPSAKTVKNIPPFGGQQIPHAIP